MEKLRRVKVFKWGKKNGVGKDFLQKIEEWHGYFHKWTDQGNAIFERENGDIQVVDPHLVKFEDREGVEEWLEHVKKMGNLDLNTKIQLTPKREFRKELKYFVVKIKDFRKLPKHRQDRLMELLQEIKTIRLNEGKPSENSYIVCNRDEPYAEAVWHTIETGEKAKADVGLHGNIEEDPDFELQEKDV